MNSPFVYRGDPAFRADFLAFANRHADRATIARHYLHLGERQRRVYFPDRGEVALKKLFYALRPAAALRWLRAHPDAAIAPMHFPTLMRECDPPAALAMLVDGLIARKAETRELGSAPLPDLIADFVDGEFAAARSALPDRASPPSQEARDNAERFFRHWVRRLGD